jgi:hypothetical protein
VAVVNASLLAAGAVTLSSSYAVGEVLGVKHSLHRRFADARVFHGSFAAMVGLAAAAVLIPGLPFGAITVFVQALTGVLLPTTLVLLLLLCNDEELLGPLRNGPWRNTVAVAAITLILGLSTLLTITLVAPRLPLQLSIAATAGFLLIIGLPVALAAGHGRRSSPGSESSPMSAWQRQTWSAPALERWRPPRRTPPRLVALAVVRVYVLVIVTLLIARLVS